MNELEQFRHDKNDLFAHQPESPLTDEQKQAFKGLNYYPENPNLIFRDLTLEPASNEEVVQIKTSQGDTEDYKRRGKIKFEISGTPCELAVFEGVENQNLFLAFRDKTNGEQTYHDGRYLEIEEENGKIKELDFNYAYNPYCAYNDRWRCPVTPEENTLPVAIEAGEKKFH
jgi:uncharacterized protein (DUF1684 family)